MILTSDCSISDAVTRGHEKGGGLSRFVTAHFDEFLAYDRSQGRPFRLVVRRFGEAQEFFHLEKSGGAHSQKMRPDGRYFLAPAT